MSHAQQSAVVLATGPGDKVFLRIDAALLRGDLDTLYTTTAGLQDQIDTLSWEDVLTNGTTPGVDVDFFGYSALGLGSVTTTGMFTGDSLFLNKDAVISGRLNVNDVVSFTDSLLVSGTVVLGDSIRVVGAASFGSRLHVTGVTAFGDSIHVVGNVDLDALFHVDGAATFGSTITVSGETTLNDSLYVGGNAYFDQLLKAQALRADSSLAVSGAASNWNSTALGGSSSSTGINAAAIGYMASATNTHAVALGSTAAASGINAVAIGDGSSAAGTQSVAVGKGAMVSSPEANVAVGVDASIAGGWGNTAVGGGRLTGTSAPTHNVAIGASTISSDGAYNISLGYSSTISGSNTTGSMTFGPSSTVSGGYRNMAFGANSSITGGNSNYAFGDWSSVTDGWNSAAFGNDSKVQTNAANAYAFGAHSSVGAFNTANFAYASPARFSNLALFGSYADTTAMAPSAFSHSSWIPTDPLFVVANGASDGARSNTLTILKNGKATFSDSLVVEGIANFTSEVSFTDSLHGAAADFSGVLTADSLVATKVINGQIRDLANHTTDGLVETATNRYFTPAREQVLQAQLDSLSDLLGDLLDQLFDPATITTTAATPVAATTASIRATYNAGGAQVDASGFIFSENSDLSDSTVFNVTGSSNALLKALTSLSEGTTYYYRAFIETIMGRAEGATLSFTTIADPTVSSLAVTNAGQTTATLRGSVDSAGGGVVSATGFKYGTSALLAGATNTAGSATSGTYIKALTGLAPTTTYYYAAYATNEAGTSYGDTLNFTTLGPCNGATTLNFNGYTYDIVEIGNQCWFAENLRNTSPTDICAPTPTIYTAVLPSDDLPCGFPDTDYLNAYGYLYEYAISWSNHCPTGWSLPTNADFTALLSSVSNNALALQSTTGWGPTLSGGGTNSSGFNAFPGGASDDSGMGSRPWTGVGEQAIFWSSTTGLSLQTLTLTYGSSAASTGWWADMSGGSGGGNKASIRCIKD
jgi:uncharacterized protein (TIGR02145 family)